MIEYYRYPEGEYKAINVDCKRRPTGAQLEHLIRMIEENVEAVSSIDDVYKSLETIIKTDMILRNDYIKQE